MVVVMEERATEGEIRAVGERLVGMGFRSHRSDGETRAVIGAVGDAGGDAALIGVQSGVKEVVRITEPYKLASRTFRPEDTIVDVGGVRVGVDEVVVMAGPCSAETDEQVDRTAAAVS